MLAAGSGSTDSGFLPLIASARRQSRGRAATVQISRLLTWGTEQLARSGLSPIEAKWLLEWALGVDSLIKAEEQVGIRSAEKYRSAIAQRRRHVPLQHITGEMQFRSLNLEAGPGVFNVRPETEMLVDLALLDLPGGRAKVADLCSGSGAVGLALACERPQTEAWLVEVDPTAARYLERNARRVRPYADGSTVQVRVEDATAGLAGQEDTFALVVSNPPYVGLADAPTQPEALADPAFALFGGGEDGMVTPRGVVGRAYELLTEGGRLVMEHGYQQGAALRDHAVASGFSRVSTVDDWAGKPRFLVAEK